MSQLNVSWTFLQLRRSFDRFSTVEELAGTLARASQQASGANPDGIVAVFSSLAARKGASQFAPFCESLQEMTAPARPASSAGVSTGHDGANKLG